ncbi:phosphocholine-specific phospholipase C [Halioxenophilus sp. WMMB6]|uniref:phosphocholine-specific phospholipase C n=1 Tax=Halioxenophilus sp. WMMB6 TaxID=3073815 RepID=UPI00295F0853|nr:phospholipase C, phosphocholine-specific [Halioxenophilus sp. WMMB6]
MSASQFDSSRRKFLQASAATAALSTLPPAIQKALAVPANNRTGSINDVEHIVILMQENRSFDHYFGAFRGVRGFGDPFPIPLASGKPVWYQSDGTLEITPYRLDKRTMNAALIPSTPHNFPDAQAAWNQGKMGYWPQVKTEYSMGYYTGEEAPFQWALADAFTLCDQYHCSVQTGTDPNRIVFWSGSVCDPDKRAAGINCTDADGEPSNLRCWIKGALPEPGYTYQGSAFNWATIPDVLQAANIGWRIYQDPNDNWTGAMHGGLAFDSFRTARPGSPLYENGMRHWSLADLTRDVVNNTLPAVSWVLPSRLQSEHPGGPSSPHRGGDFTHQVLEALTANPEVWSKTVFFLTFDENDGLFDHIPPPAVPSYNPDGSLAGKATLELAGMYFKNDAGTQYLRDDDTTSGNLRPWGAGPRVPMYVVSPWSKGGWVCSQAFDHTSVGQFIEQRFNVTVPAISPWHRAICGDLTTAFDFESPNDPHFPNLPDVSNYQTIETVSKTLPTPSAPATPQPLYQEAGVRYSRALPYELNVSAEAGREGRINLTFANSGRQGAVFHVYDKNHLERIPRRYTVEAGKQITDDFWQAEENGGYDLWVYSTNGFVRSFSGKVKAGDHQPQASLSYHKRRQGVMLTLSNPGSEAITFNINATAYQLDKRERSVTLKPKQTLEKTWSVADSGNWYDIKVAAENFQRRFAGRVENGKPTVSDPLMGRAADAGEV